MGMFRDSKIYIAGHRGLLGSAVLKRLKSDGYRNIITRTHRELDLTDKGCVERFFRKERPEYVFLCAGLTGGIIANQTYPVDFLNINIAIQTNVFDAANRFDVKNIVFYGSSCVYPRDSVQPIKEEYLMTGEIEPTSEAYAIAKTAGIIACRSYNNQFKTKRFIALVPNTMYGIGDHFDLENSHVLSALIRRLHEAKINKQKKVILWGTGQPRREFVFNEDVADASIFAVNNAEKLDNTHYNVGTGVDYSIKELANIIAEIVGFKGDIEWDTSKPDGAPRKLLDSTRFMRLGWSPNIQLKEGIEKTYLWYKKVIRSK